jgi:nucleoid-associated protein YgaU
MPTVAGPPKSSVGNLANSFSNGNPRQNLSPVEDAPVFGGTASMDAQPTPELDIRPLQAKPLMAQPLIVEDRRAPVVRKKEFNLSPPKADTYDTANIDLRSGENLSRFRSAKPVVSVQAETRQPEAGLNSVLDKTPLDNRVSRSGFDSGKVARVVAKSTSQRRVERLPFRLNRDARTNLVRLRDQAAHKISLKTTQFSDYVVEAGDTLQTISTGHFGKPDYYLDIYMANRNQLNSPGELQDGMILRIPVYQ